jgi:hypothetical protein
MLQDPGQYVDIASHQPGLAARLRESVRLWKEEVAAGDSRDDRPFLIGHPGRNVTQLPARDGVAHGTIQRSNRFPNCSYFTNWTGPDDKITWDAEVLTSGTYEVELHYTCPAADVGATIELSFGDNRLTGRISEAHDPPLRGGEHDRVPRMESYVKDFKPLKLGTIRLEQGRSELTLRALKMPGSQVMDFRLLVLTRTSDLASTSP